MNRVARKQPPYPLVDSFGAPTVPSRPSPGYPIDPGYPDVLAAFPSHHSEFTTNTIEHTDSWRPPSVPHVTHPAYSQSPLPSISLQTKQRRVPRKQVGHVAPAAESRLSGSSISLPPAPSSSSTPSPGPDRSRTHTPSSTTGSNLVPSPASYSNRHSLIDPVRMTLNPRNMGQSARSSRINHQSAPRSNSAPRPQGRHARRKALIIGINYIGSPRQLRGCINDARAMFRFLTDRWGYKKDDVLVLTDDQRNPASIPTKRNIIKAMRWLVSDVRPGDHLVIHYSGHGGVTKDLDGDEEDGFDEVIYPVDYKVAGHIVDDEINSILVQAMPLGSRLTGIFDSCHSGSVMDLPYMYSTKGDVKGMSVVDVGKEASSGLVGAIFQGDFKNSYELGRKLNAMTTKGFSKAHRERIIKLKGSAADVIQLSGCKDSQTSADVNGVGALSYAFISVMSHEPRQSYQSLLLSMRKVMKGRFEQKPQLSCSHPLDIRKKFEL